MNNCMAVMITEAKRKVQPDKPLEERLKSAMKVTFQHWLVLDEEEQFRAAIGAVLLSASEEEKERIKKELDGLRALSAMTSGVPVDMKKLIENQANCKPIGLVKLWKEIQKKEAE